MSTSKDTVTVEPIVRFPYGGEGRRPGVAFQVSREQADRMVAERFVREVTADTVDTVAPGNKRSTYGRRDMRATGNAG